MASFDGHEDIVKYLVEHGADINKECNVGATPLSIASLRNHTTVIKYLIEHGAKK